MLQGCGDRGYQVAGIHGRAGQCMCGGKTFALLDLRAASYSQAAEHKSACVSFPKAVLPDVVTYTTLMKTCIHHGVPHAVSRWLQRMMEARKYGEVFAPHVS
eukprot:6086254-Amphidinium_carterae.2